MMPHREERRISGKGKCALLFVHGIAGTPRHFDAFISRLPESTDYVNLLLPGHGGGVRDFSAASMTKWRSAVDKAAAELLESHEGIIIIAHSMGTLFAMEQALIRPERVKALFLLAVPLKLRLRPVMAVNSAKVLLDRTAGDPRAEAARDCYGIERDLRLWRYLGWIPRYLELFKEIRAARVRPEKLRCPCLVFQSAMDEMVSLGSLEYLRKGRMLSVQILEGSGHYYYPPEDREMLLSAFESFVKADG